MKLEQTIGATILSKHKHTELNLDSYSARYQLGTIDFPNFFQLNRGAKIDHISKGFSPLL